MDKIKNVHSLADEEIEDCIEGSSNIDMIRDILTKHGVIDLEGRVDAEVFADWFAQAIEDYIEADVDSDEWTEAFDNNWNWGYNIADNINDLLEEKQ